MIRKTWPYLIFILCAGYLITAATTLAKPHVETLTYEIRKQDETAIQTTTITKKESSIICVVSRTDKPQNKYRCVLDKDYETQQSHIIDLGNNADVKLQKDNHVLYIKGKNKGKSVNKKVKLPATPFYQNMFLSLRPFVVSGKKDMVFSTLRPDNLKPYKFRAQKLGNESITVGAGTFTASKVKVGLTGALSALFSIEMWFRKSDGVLLKRTDMEKNGIELVDVRYQE